MPILEDLKSPLIEENENGTYSITFYYQSPDPSLNPIVTLDSSDLHEWMIDKTTGLVRAFDRDEATGLYSLKLDGIPSAPFFATYGFKVKNGTEEHFVHDAANKESLKIRKLNLSTKEDPTIENIVDQTTSYIRLQDAKLPDWIDIQPSSKIVGTVTHKKFGDNSVTGTPRQERDVWVYEPEGFKDLKKSDKKVIFMLDGKDMCERLVPYIDKTPELSNTAIVFINPGEYEPPIPGRVQEYYWNEEESTDFVNVLANDLIPHYVQELGVANRNVILEAHSLGAFPMITVAKKIPDKIGGLNLISPALNQKGELFPTPPNPELKKIPISIQIGQLENAGPPIAHRQYQRMADESRLEATKSLHQALQDSEYRVEPELRINVYGHDSIHVYEGTVKGVQFIQNCQSKADTATIAQTRSMKSRLNEVINRGVSSSDKAKQKSHTESTESSTPSPLSITPKLKL